MADDTSQEPFPWHLGVYDAHCHPTDTMSSIPFIQKMKARALTVMATRLQDQELVSSVADKHGIKSASPAEWEEEECIVPCFGWHPWFSHQMYIEEEEAEQGGERKKLEGEEKVKHYQSVLQPSKTELTEEDRRMFLSWPDPTSFVAFLSETRQNLQKYPLALVGEIGLDRSFRIPEAWNPDLEQQRNDELTPGGREGRRLSPYRVDLKHQKKIVKMQLQLAAELGRAVSVHGVQAHGLVFDTLKELYEGHERKVLSRKQQKKQARDQKNETDVHEKQESGPMPYPPRICLHSYSGNPSNFKQYLNPAIPVEIFASFSTAINLSDAVGEVTPRSFEDMIEVVPHHMLLVESDLHIAGDRMDTHLEDIVRRICNVKAWKLEEGVRILGDNWRRFAFGKKT
ncbi:hypothetical protein BDV96DRAFT_651414 [Lophiotrema nucula]|uniref:Metallo-dependent hydrolase n=1 Tax=Lophiotrema nucula TaxID=690887 RepID=A0A6A5YTK2_9PLEO|nr:hypothetical protein BDV96DRAFT_651414 [Lophiotrema nucula]